MSYEKIAVQLPARSVCLERAACNRTPINTRERRKEE